MVAVILRRKKVKVVFRFGQRNFPHNFLLFTSLKVSPLAACSTNSRTTSRAHCPGSRSAGRALIIGRFDLLAVNSKTLVNPQRPGIDVHSKFLRRTLDALSVVWHRRDTTAGSGRCLESALSSGGGRMRCSKCGCQEDKVIDSRTSREGATIRRRRECLSCGHRFTTYEEIENEGMMVVKRDDRREPFSREKLLNSLRTACQKRPVNPNVLQQLADKIQDEIADKFDREVPSMAIGERVMQGLKAIDQVAYVRFASVYRRFEEPTEFVQEVKKLEETK
jgi:transcriptional repressor NrdR